MLSLSRFPRIRRGWQRWLPLLLFLLLSYLPLFWLLTSLPAQQWDESRTGVNALGIWKHHDWLVLRHSGQPDLWNGKPPLWMWTLAVSFRVLGASELGLRLPAALAALATALLLYRAAQRWIGPAPAGLLAGLILLTSQGYVTLHVTRTGDFDSLLTLWTTTGALAWLAYLRTGRPRWAGLTGLAFALAVLTKGIAGLLFGPGLLLAMAFTGQWRRLRRPAPWLALLLVLATAATWYTVREWAAPGYLGGVWAYEVGGPAGEQLEGHIHPFEFYLNQLAERQFTAWLVAALLGWLIGAWLPRYSRGWWLSRLTGAVALGFLLVISTVQTRMTWYDAPVFPILALQAAAGLTWTGQILARHFQRRVSYRAALAGALAVLALPYLAQWQYVRQLQQSRLLDPQLLYGRHLRAQARQLPAVREYLVATLPVLNDSPEFYCMAAEFNHGHRTTRTTYNALDQARPGQTVVSCGSQSTRPWLQRYDTQVLLRTDSCVTLRLLRRR
ncbi:phospholipid carrier-dependent glycosyltransferase [Hymenobacter gummosus]|uniref:Phospholipid carrier-dependent glycosyltransferase n=1 Tax=Hymenobacter gummosus TaxID=1776032 RepID=A0A3S0K3E5_9BACT|nr:glycosyltransferase family 39 protein [Hymenobacter gummosus]RTQ47593.1 phospholipid carrier-dependent glycosyltransferase [Hymenobacter gummosus]